MHRKVRSSRRRIVAVATALLCGCSSSSSGGAGSSLAASNLSGYWKIWYQPTGGVETGPGSVFFQVDGDSLDMVGVTGSVQGDAFSLRYASPSAPGDVATFDGRLTSPTEASGTFDSTIAGRPLAGTFRMAKFAPTGSVDVSGVLSGTEVTHRSSTALGLRRYRDANRTVVDKVVVQSSAPKLEFGIDIDPAQLRVGTLRVGNRPGDVQLSVCAGTAGSFVESAGENGTLDVSKYDAGGFAAKYLLNLASGDTVSGSFDVKFELDSE